MVCPSGLTSREIQVPWLVVNRAYRAGCKGSPAARLAVSAAARGARLGADGEEWDARAGRPKARPTRTRVVGTDMGKLRGVTATKSATPKVRGRAGNSGAEERKNLSAGCPDRQPSELRLL